MISEWAKVRIALKVVILGICLGGVPVFADIIELKNGKTLKGYYVAVRGPFTIIRTQEGILEKIPSASIKGIQIDYKGHSSLL